MTCPGCAISNHRGYAIRIGCTPIFNREHARRIKQHAGSGMRKSKFSNIEIADMRNRRMQGYTFEAIAKYFATSRQHIHYLLMKRIQLKENK